jgi:hypothetical protein
VFGTALNADDLVLTGTDLELAAEIPHTDVAETITGNWVNTDNPWADNEVADDLTISGGTVNNSVIGGSTAAAITGTTIKANTSITLEGGANDTTIDAGTPSEAVTYTLPASDGIANQYLKTDGSGNLSFGDPSGSGDITYVGDVASGEAFTADGGGNTLYFEGTSANDNEIALVGANPGSDVTVTIPAATGTLLLSDGDGSALTSVDAATGDSATAFFDAGAIETTYGGTGTDLSSTSGIMGMNAGTYVDIDTAAELETYANLGAYASDILGAADSDALVTLLGLVAGDIPDLSDTYEAKDAEIARMDTADEVKADWEWNDNVARSIGSDNDWQELYDESGDDRWEFVHTAGAGADVYWDLNDNAADSTFTITNSNATYKANLDVEGTITATAFESDADDGERYTVFGNNSSGNQPDTATVATGAYGYETDMYFVVGSSIHTVLDAGGDIVLYGATDDNGFEYLVDITDPTADRTITIDDDNIDFTAGESEDNYVLKYDNSTATWSAEADSTGSALGSNLSSSDFNISSDTGVIQLNGTGDTNNEDLDFDFETDANQVGISSDTGVTIVDFGTIELRSTGLDAGDDNITNVGTISIDAIAADGTNVIFGSAAATQLQFRDSNIYIASLDDGHLDIEADTSIDLNAPVSGNGNWTTTGNVTAANLLIADTGTIGSASDTDAMSIAADGDVDVVNDFTAGTITSDAALTATTNVVIGDDGNIGSASDTDAIAISAGGEVTLSQELQAGAGIDVSGGTLVVGTISGTMTDGTASWNGSTQALTGFATFETDAAEVNGTITLANDETIVNSTDGTIGLTGDAVDIPSGANPDTGAEGEMAIDSDDNFIEFYGSAVRVIGSEQSESFTLRQPDDLQSESDDLKLKKFVAEAYPHGVEITSIHVDCSEAISDTLLFQEWDDNAGSTQATVESIALSTAATAEDDGVDDGTMAADSFLVVNLDDAQDDISEILITITYYIIAGD